MDSKMYLALSVALAVGILSGCSDNNSNNRPLVDVRSNPASDYTRVDRTGQPAVATALLRTGGQPIREGVPVNNNATNERDSFNQGDPAGDAGFAGAFVDNLINVNNALADDLDSLGLARCSTGAPGTITTADQISACIDVAAPVVIPDVITLDISRPGGWPNGRHPDDPVVDRLLAAVLLDLSVLPLDTFADLPLNPPGNDARADDPSPTNFPYLRDPIDLP